jgi:hypothetical protein
LGLLLAVATSVPAFAEQPTVYPVCTKPVGTAESELAHQKYIAGKQDYDEKNYDSAIRRFRDAYNLDCTKHELLIIISAAYERKGDKKEALNALETYVARAPNAPDVGTYQAGIDNLKKQIAATPPPAPAPTSTGAPPPGSEVQEHTALPWIVFGGGVAALGVGIVLLATAPQNPSNCIVSTTTCTKKANESDADLKADQDQAGNAKGQPIWGTATTIVGGIAVVGGLAWHFLEPTGPKDKDKEAWHKKLRPILGRGNAGLAFSGRF